MKRFLSLVAATMMVVACRESRHLSAPRVAPPDLAIVDARNDATRTGFYFLAPIRPISFPPPWSGTFDAGLSPVVEICELNAGACVLPPVSRLTMTDGLEIDRVHVFPGLQEYNVLWRTRELGLRDDKTYRIQVLVGGTVLGYADVDVVRTIRQLLAVDREEYVALLDDLILPIRFRIERGSVFPIGSAGGQVAVGASTLTIPSGALDHTVGITARSLTTYPDAAKAIAGTVTDFGPDGLTFATPARLTIAYDPSRVPTGTSEGSVRVLQLVNGAWQTVPGSSVDVSTRTVTAPIAHFTTFAAGAGSFTLTIRTQGAPGSVSISDGINPANTCNYVDVPCTFTFPAGTSLTLVATAQTDMRFEDWSSSNGTIACTTDRTCSVTLDQDRDISARFSTPGLLSVDRHQVDVAAPQGSVATATVTVSNSGGRPVTLGPTQISYSQQVRPWLQATMSSGTVNQFTSETLTLTVLPNVLPPGQYRARVTFGDFLLTVAQVDVTLTVQSTVLYAFDGTGQWSGPLPIIPAFFTNSTGTDVYPVGTGETYIFSIFDTGSNLLVISTVVPPGGQSDAQLLNIGTGSATNPNQNVRVRINGLSAVDPVSLTAPMNAYGTPGGAQAEVIGLRAGPRSIDATLIGAPVTNQVVARIDNTTMITRGIYDFCGCNAVEPDVTLWMPSDGGIPAPSLLLPLQRFGATTPALLDQATTGQRYFLNDVVFQNGTNAVMEGPMGSQPIRLLFDTGARPTIINMRLATALGLNATTSGGGSFDCWDDPGLEGFVIDRISFPGTTSSGAQGTYAVDHAWVCVDVHNNQIATQYANTGGTPAAPKVDAVIGESMFMYVPYLFHGVNNKLGILTP